MTQGATVVTDSDTAQDGIPLNLAPLLAPYGQHKRLSLRVVYLPPRAALSQGVRNEDASWSLAPDDLDGLQLLIPDDSEPPATVAVRVITIDRTENASIIGQFEVPLPRGATAAAAKGGNVAAINANWQHRMARRGAAAERLARRKVTLALAQAEAQGQPKIAAERAAREKAEAKAADATQKIAALAAELEEATARIAAADPPPTAAEIDARIMQEAEARTASARSGWQKESEDRIAAAVEQARREAEAAAEAQLAQALETRTTAARSEWAKETEARANTAVEQARREADAAAEARLDAARAAWQEGAEREIAVAKQRYVQAELAAQQFETRLAEAEAQWQAESDTRLSNHEQVLELEWRQKILDERNARQAAEAKAEEAARKLTALAAELEAAAARAAAAEAAAAGQDSARLRFTAEAEARLAQELEARTAAARADWARENQARIAAAVEPAVRKAEAKAASRLAEARKKWEREMRDALAIAEGQWQAAAAKRLAAAQMEWSRNAPAAAAAGRRKLRGVARRQWLPAAGRQIRRIGVVAACVVTAFVLVTEFKPVILRHLNVGAWKPKVMALAGDVKATALSEYESLIDEAKPRRRVAAEVANVRSGPSTATEVVATLPRDSVVTVLERRGEWIRIGGDKGHGGWLHSSLLEGATDR